VTPARGARLWRLHAPAAWLAGAALGTGLRPVRAATDAPAGGAPRSRVDASRLPAPGSYRLSRIMATPDGEVLASDGRSERLHGVLRGRLTVLSFMYTYCRDPEGCPRAWAAMETVQAALQADRTLAAQSQLVSLSFDPSHDTPAQMRAYGGERALDARVRWRFLTTASVSALLPLLRGFGQDVSIETDAAGRPTRTLNHLLKLFLVDAALQVREIYSVATLEPQAIVNDLRTLQAERAANRP
jgi:cytochrome oxidase Cu insertion factor (SCO1/SenC/PrrC family)